MNLYLTIITTVLVLTQIIRLTQNAKQLKHLHRIHKYDDYIYSVYEKLNKALVIYLDKEIEYHVGNCRDCKHEDCECEEEPCKSCMNNHMSNFELMEEK